MVPHPGPLAANGTGFGHILLLPSFKKDTRINLVYFEATGSSNLKFEARNRLG
jgi:hypothetical protein